MAVTAHADRACEPRRIGVIRVILSTTGCRQLGLSIMVWILRREGVVVALLQAERARSGFAGGSFRLQEWSKVVERGADSITDRQVDGDRVMPAAHVLHECMPGCDGARRAHA